MGLPTFPNPCFGPDELGLCLGCCGWTWAWRGAHCAFGLADGIFGLFLYPYQFECQQRMVFYKCGLYKAYRTCDEAIRASMLYSQGWKRTEVATTLALFPPKYGHEDSYEDMQDIAFSLLKCFIIGSIASLLYLVVIWKL